MQVTPASPGILVCCSPPNVTAPWLAEARDRELAAVAERFWRSSSQPQIHLFSPIPMA